MEPNKWHRSTYSNPNGNCVEVMEVPDAVMVRDSKLGEGAPIQTYTPQEWQAFLDGAQAGEFNLRLNVC